MERYESKKEIAKALRSEDYQTRITAIRSLSKLNGDDALGLIQNVLNLKANLGMKLEALRELPLVINHKISNLGCRILQRALADEDPEILRNTMLTIQVISPEFANKSLLDEITTLLSNEDTDIIYQAVLTLIHLHSRIPSDDYYLLLKPLTKHPNKVLRELVTKAVANQAVTYS